MGFLPQPGMKIRNTINKMYLITNHDNTIATRLSEEEIKNWVLCWQSINKGDTIWRKCSFEAMRKSFSVILWAKWQNLDRTRRNKKNKYIRCFLPNFTTIYVIRWISPTINFISPILLWIGLIVFGRWLWRKSLIKIITT